MKFETKFEVLQLADLVTPPYNPRVDMEPDSPEYKALRRSLEQHQLVEPPVVNLHNMRCIGGNQRVAVMLALGMTEVLCSVIDQPDESKEKKLCLALNRVDGRWDTDKLGDLLRDDDVLEYETGFDAEEVRVYRLLEDAREPDDDGDYPGDDPEDDEPEPEDDEPEPEDDEPEPEDDEPPEDEGDTGEGDEEPRLGSTLIKIGHLSFKVEVYRYKRVVEAMRDRGIFDEKEIAAEWKRRLLHHD